VPSLVLFGQYVNAYVAAALGLIFIIGRAVYFRGYVHSVEGRHVGFILSAVPNVTLLLGALIGAARAHLIGGF
jgi:glutathione S-transferase